MTITIHLMTMLKILAGCAYALAGFFIGMPLLSLYCEGKPRLDALTHSRIWGLTFIVLVLSWVLWLPLLLLIVLIALLNPETYRD